MRVLTFSFVGLALSLPAAAGIGGPVQGFVVDHGARAIRPVNGLPGASLLGEGLAVGGAVDRAAVDSRRGIAIVSLAQADGGGLAVVRGIGTRTAVQRIEGGLPSPDMVVLNAAGTAGALYSRAARTLQIITGLDSTARLSSIETAELGTVSSLAVTADGAAVAGVNGGVYLLRANSQPELLAEAKRPAAIAIDGSGLLIADAGTGEVTRIEALRAFAVRRTILATGEGIDIVGLAISADRSRIAVVDRGSRTVSIWNALTAAKESLIELVSEPTRCQAMDSADVFALNEAGAEPLLLLDMTENGNPRVLFVPLFVPMQEKE